MIRKRNSERKGHEKAKSDPLLEAELKEKEHLKYLKKKTAENIKPVFKLSSTGKRIQMKRWKINQRHSRTKKKNHLTH